jgi:hypothetical protein
MKKITLLSFLLMMSCISQKKYQTLDYDRLSPNHKKIAILPIIFEDKKFKTGISDDEKKATMEKENDFVQNAFYQRLSLKSGYEKMT